MASDDLPFYESERGTIVKWMDGDNIWHEGPLTGADDALECEHYIVSIPTDEGDQFYTVHYPPTPDFDLDWEIDRIDSEYGEDGIAG